MKKRNIKFNINILYLIIAIIVVLMLIFGQRKEEFIKEDIIIIGEESIGSGFLEIETIPSSSEIFIDGVSRGISPITIYNVDAGPHNVIIKKEGYEDFTSEVKIDAGRKTFLESRLVLITPIEEKLKPMELIEDGIDSEEIVEEEAQTDDLIVKGIVNIGSKFIIYYDFSEGEFAENRNFEQDTFSKRYSQYLIFTRINPIKIKTINKDIEEVQREDCVGINGQYEWLYSGQSLCIITKENNVGAIGGLWDDTENAELTYKIFS